jgi:hypothetical protein
MRKRILLLLIALLALIGCTRADKPETADLPPVQEITAVTELLTAAPTPLQTIKPTQTPSAVPEITCTPEPTPTPTPSPSPTPETITDEALDEGALDSFFNNSVLIGDSMTASFSGYAATKRNENPMFFGDMRFIHASAYTLDTAYHVEKGERYPWLKYRGIDYSVSDLVQAMEVGTAYLLLGVDDIQIKSVEENMMQLDTIVRNIQEKSPQTKLVLITIPPVLESYAREQRHPENIHDEVNDALRAYCAENGLDYIELSDRVCGEDGYLRPEFCTDNKFHFNKVGNAVWARAFREYARAQYDCGAWTLPEDGGEP